MRALKTSASLALLLGLGAITVAAPASAQFYGGGAISVGFAPPPLPYYDQPPIPGYGYIWTPGYWAWDEGYGDYYWVPGTWILPPRIGFLWTPGWWGWQGGRYLFNAGYWGPHVGFYGGVNYGFGYNGFGYGGGEWRGRDFYYNRSVNNVRNIAMTNVYNRAVLNNTIANRVSYSGGRGGVQARPTAEQLAATREQHVSFTPQQQQHVQAARLQPALRANNNHGAPAIAATARPAAFSGQGVVPARGPGGGYRPPAGAGQPPRPNGGNGGIVGQRPSQPMDNRPAPGPRPDYQNGRPNGGAPGQFGPNRPQPRPTPAMERPQPQLQPRPQPQQPRPQPQQFRPQMQQPRPQMQQPRPQMQQPRPQPQAERPQGPRPQQRSADQRDHPQR